MHLCFFINSHSFSDFECCKRISLSQNTLCLGPVVPSNTGGQTINYLESLYMESTRDTLGNRLDQVPPS